MTRISLQSSKSSSTSRYKAPGTYLSDHDRPLIRCSGVVNPHFSPPFSVCPKRRIGTPHRADTSDRCIALPPERRIGTPHRNGAPPAASLQSYCGDAMAHPARLSLGQSAQHSVTMPAHPPNNVCRYRQALLGVVATNLPGADLNSFAGPKGGGQDARNRVWQGTTYRRPATNGGEKCGLTSGHFQVRGF